MARKKIALKLYKVDKLTLAVYLILLVVNIVFATKVRAVFIWEVFVSLRLATMLYLIFSLFTSLRRERFVIGVYIAVECVCLGNRLISRFMLDVVLEGQTLVNDLLLSVAHIAPLLIRYSYSRALLRFEKQLDAIDELVAGKRRNQGWSI